MISVSFSFGRRIGGRPEPSAADCTPGICRTLASRRAQKLSRRAARIGFDWPDANGVIAKVTEEIAEIEAEIELGAECERLEDEVGDLLFAATNLARKLGIEAETALRRATAKFERRFRQVEALAASRDVGRDLDALEALWNEVKQMEK